MIYGSSTYSTPRLKNLSVKRQHIYRIINSNYHRISSKHGTNISHRRHPFYPAIQKQKGKAEAVTALHHSEENAFLLHLWGAKIIPVAGDFCPISLVLTRYSFLTHSNEWETTTLLAVISILFQL